MGKHVDEHTRTGVETIVLRDEDWNFVREHKVLIDQQRLILASLQSALFHRLRAGYGVDVERENWELDLDRGLLHRQTDTHTFVDTNIGTDMYTRSDIKNDTTTD